MKTRLMKSNKKILRKRQSVGFAQISNEFITEQKRFVPGGDSLALDNALFAG